MPSKPYSFETRVTYADTDRMGVVYYGNYLALFEKGRTELMRDEGIRYRDLEEVNHVYLPCSEANVKYLAPAKYDDLIRIKTWVKELKGAHIDFEYIIENAETGIKLAVGTTRHPFVNNLWHPVRPPKSLKEKFS